MTSTYQASEDTYQGLPAITLRGDRYEAVVLPGVGANLIAFRDTVNGSRFLREPAPEEMDAFLAKPGVHGMPVLFPPNRYEDGKFRWNNAVYEFPVNEEARGNHLHGFLHTIPWEVEEFGATAASSYVSLVQRVDAQHAVYRYFPHAFTFRLRYTLSADGLMQHVSIRNNGSEAMPCLLGFHTAINAPFEPGSTESDCTFTLTTGQRYEMTERMLPTGAFQPLNAGEEAMKAGGISPWFEEMDNHYTAVPQNGHNRMVLTDGRTGTKLIYDAGTAYKYWMVWNNQAAGQFFCPEPQINLVNAPNVDLPAEETGLVRLAPGEIWEETSRLYVVRAQ
ncbi:aldose 1-epimerase [Paenibacillus sp. UNCCL117]|uniref:aldose 1-epimerase n=1 Tax=unclassified Paenibacillus TaxID=185978 RepID=UPI00088F9670|nr:MULTISPECIES: aldose 1-epimerase [unclassified Paenibacillus]SDC66713.1 aldose 1-epimerase [Paenibacillus sp. cl123]SFW23121.1 aldose 1-epimerase [Paenibacillus sp. UNCCL117]